MLKINVLGCHGGGEKDKGLTSLLINDTILIDAGNVVGSLLLEEQKEISHILITHTHLDHIKDIPLLADNFVSCKGHKVNVFGMEKVVSSLKENFFNNVIFPDFSMIPINDPILHYHTIYPDKPFNLNGLIITAIELNHTVPNVGYIVENEDVAFVFISDTYKTDKIFDIINENKKIKFVIIETSFPNQFEHLAEISKHLTPNLMKEQIEKIKDNNIKIYIYHMKPNYTAKIIDEIDSIETDKDIEFLRDGMIIEI